MTVDPLWARKFKHTLTHATDDAVILRAMQHQWELTQNVRDLLAPMSGLNQFRRERLFRMMIEQVEGVSQEMGRLKALLPIKDRAYVETIQREQQNIRYAKGIRGI